jgi:hypothetical protein
VTNEKVEKVKTEIEKKLAYAKAEARIKKLQE